MGEVVLRHVCKFFEKNEIISDANIEIKDKEFLILVGPSGCGKSTILRMIAGLENVTTGEIEIDGKVVNDVHPKDRDIAFVFQSYALYPHMTVFDNIGFPLKMRGMQKEKVAKKVYEAAEILDLTDLLDRRPKQLSGGQRQRVALGRAIVRNPKVFLMDEPLSNLDAKLRVQMRTELKRLHERLQTTFIYVTHDQTEALTMGDRIAIIDKGVIQQTDTPENVYKFPSNAFVAGFMGSPPMNFIPIEIFDRFFTINKLRFELTGSLADRLKGRDKAILGIRPEKMSNLSKDIFMKVNVDMWEVLGSEKIAYFTINGEKATMRVSPEKKNTQRITLSISFDDVICFDFETKERIF